MSIFKSKDKVKKERREISSRKTRGCEGGGKIGPGKEKSERNKVFGRLLLYLDKGEKCRMD